MSVKCFPSRFWIWSSKVIQIGSGVCDWFSPWWVILSTHICKRMFTNSLVNETFLQGAVVSLLCSLGLSMGIGITPLQSTLLTWSTSQTVIVTLPTSDFIGCIKWLLTGHWCLQCDTAIDLQKYPKHAKNIYLTKLPDKGDGSTRCFEAPFASSSLQCFLSDSTMYCFSQVAFFHSCNYFFSCQVQPNFEYYSGSITFDFQPVFPCSAWHHWPCHTRITRFSK